MATTTTAQMPPAHYAPQGKDQPTTAQLAVQPTPPPQAQLVVQPMPPAPPPLQARPIGLCADKVGHGGVRLLVRETKRSKRYEVTEAGTKRKLLRIRTNFFTMHMRKELFDVQDKDGERHLFDMVYDYSGVKSGDLLTSFAVHYPKLKKSKTNESKKGGGGGGSPDGNAEEKDPGGGEKVVEIKGNFKLVGSKSTITFRNPLAGGHEERLEMTGNWGAFKGDVTDASAGDRVLASFDRDYGVRDFLLAKQTYAVSVAAGVDWSLMALLCVAMDHRSDAWWSQ